MTATCGSCGVQAEPEVFGPEKHEISGEPAGWSTLTLSGSPIRSYLICPKCQRIIDRVLDGSPFLRSVVGSIENGTVELQELKADMIVMGTAVEAASAGMLVKVQLNDQGVRYFMGKL